MNFVQGEIADRAKLDSVFSSQHIAAVMHFSALIEAGESMKFPERFFRNNCASTLTLLEVLLATQGRPVRFLVNCSAVR